MSNSIGSQFEDTLVQHFNEDGFYAKPTSTKIYLKIKDKVVVGNSVVMNIEETNEKIPVYSYNSDIYAKHLNGKKIITGYIALRKITISAFLSLIGYLKEIKSYQEEIDEINFAIKELEKVENGNLIFSSLINEYKIELNHLITKQNELAMMTDDERFMEVFRECSDEKRTEFLENDKLLYYSDNSNEPIEISVVYEGNFNNPRLDITDVLFVKKQTEINIDKNDVIEIYQFIGNSKYVKNNRR